MKGTKLRGPIVFGLMLGASLFSGQVQANTEFPSRPIRLIVPVAAGGGLDITTRAIAQKMTQAWGQQVIVDNRPGASGVLAFDIAVDTAFQAASGASKEQAERALNSIPMKRIADADEIGELVLFMCSDGLPVHDRRYGLRERGRRLPLTQIGRLECGTGKRRFCILK